MLSVPAGDTVACGTASTAGAEGIRYFCCVGCEVGCSSAWGAVKEVEGDDADMCSPVLLDNEVYTGDFEHGNR